MAAWPNLLDDLEAAGEALLLPKGHLEHGDKLLKTAQQEAWEEAGRLRAISILARSGSTSIRSLAHSTAWSSFG